MVMVHLTTEQLSKKQLDALFTQLNQTLGGLNADKTNLFLSELLGTEERIMLAKRLAAILLIIEGTSLYRTGRILKISATTAERIKDRLDGGTYTEILKLLGKNKKNYFAVLETLDSILHLGGILPHYNGIERYRGLR